jgi:stage IV sporulation protein FA
VQIRDNVRERRRERIQQIMNQQSNVEKVEVPVGKLPQIIESDNFLMDIETSDPIPTPRGPMERNAMPSESTPGPSTPSQEVDPELWWKEREKHGKNNNVSWQGLKGIPQATNVQKEPTAHIFNFNKFIYGFIWRVVGAALLFAVAWGWIELELPGYEETNKWMVASVTRDMNFEAIEAWYGETFNGSPSFFPFNQNDTDTKEVAALLTPQITTAPTQGKIIESFAKSGTGIKIAASGGSPVSTIYTGRVQNVTQDEDGGVTILVQHPNQILTVYGGLAKSEVKPNDWVETGQIVGQLEASGDREGVLYFAALQDGKAIDPAEVVTFD